MTVVFFLLSFLVRMLYCPPPPRLVLSLCGLASAFLLLRARFIRLHALSLTHTHTNPTQELSKTHNTKEK